MESDDDFLPNSPAFVGGAALIVVAAISLFLFAHRNPVRMAPPPWTVTGCYEAVGGPNIFVDQSKLRILQNPAVETTYSLEYIKGWAFSTDSWLDVETGANGIAKIVPIQKFGEYLNLSHEGEVSARTPGFVVLPLSQGSSLHYTWTGPTCTVTRNQSSPPL